MLSVAQVAYPLAPVTPDPAGGAEQVLAQAARAVVAAGGRSIVVGQSGSHGVGAIAAHAAERHQLDEAAQGRAFAAARRTLSALLAQARVDVLDVHAIGFERLLPERRPPTLVTLHLPLAWYAAAALSCDDMVYLPVSRSQAAAAPAGVRLLAPIPNGVDLSLYRDLPVEKGGFVLWLGRVCPEKQPHVAIEAARAADLPIVLAGPLFPYPAHVAYARDVLRPLISARARWIGPVSGEAKRRLLARARCVVVASRAEETSCLVAMEAAAAGTPVAALASGALPEIVVEGESGALADDEAGLGAAIGRALERTALRCREVASERFDATASMRARLALYQAVAR